MKNSHNGRQTLLGFQIKCGLKYADSHNSKNSKTSIMCSLNKWQLGRKSTTLLTQ